MVLKRFRSSSKMKENKRIMDHDFKSSKENIVNSDESPTTGNRRDKYSKAVSESEADTSYSSPKSKGRSEERRRSSRERRLIYGTFNQSAITDVYLGMSGTKYDENEDEHSSRRHRKSSSSSPKANRQMLRSPVLKSRLKSRGRPGKRSITEISGNETSMPENSPTKETEPRTTNDDMYTRIKRQRRVSQRIACSDFVDTHLVGRRSKRSSVIKSPVTSMHPRRSLRKKARLVSEEAEEVDETHEDSESKDAGNKEAVEENVDVDGGNDNGEEEEEEEEETSESSEEEAPRKYSLRERRAPPTHFQHELRESRFRRCRMRNIYGEHSHSSNRDRRSRRPRDRMHRSRALNRGNSSTSSSSSPSDSDDGPSADEARFQRRKAKSMMKARQRCRPMNFTEEDLKANTALRDRSMIGASLADVEPMTVDKNITFESIGGLDSVVRSLKEMVLFPLMYSEVFDKFKVAPPRGVLFHGPPGTGKTLVARALANECSPEGGRKVAFFMRKGADCLSKWVGESERQLRLLFNEAYTMRPSIIFFDEIDGLAPVRSTRQDQIHSSIVSTLLALLDGLDSRGEVVVIGATNRLDALDPALRRPGRFDREFYFPLPRETARQQILKIHTSVWPNPPSGNLLDRLAKATSGYCGADLKALCTEAVLSGLRRRYPQVYLSKAKLQLDTSEIEVCETDFHVAMESIVAAGARVESSPSRPLSEIITPLVKDTLEGIVDRVRMEFPAAAQTLRQQVAGEDDADDHLISEDAVDENGKGQSWCRLVLGARGPQLLRRARLLLLPEEEDRLADQSWEERLSLDGGQAALTSENSVLDQHLLPALFHRLEGIQVFTVDSPSLFNISARTPEESLSQLWREALRLAPSIIYIPRIDELLASLPDTVTHCLTCLMQGGDPTARVFILATAAVTGQALHPRIAHFFHGCTHRFTPRPSKTARRLFFQDLFLKWPLVAPPLRRVAAQRVLEVLPAAQEGNDVIQRRLTSRESEMLFEKEEYIMRQMRLFLRDVLSKLQKDRRFSIFARPVDPEEVPDYYDIIKKPMDLATISHKINTHKYESVKGFLDDIDQICSNALEYNPDTTPADRELRNRACCLKDLAHAISKLDDHDDFNEKCAYVSNARRRRGLMSNCSLPNFYHTKPREQPPPALTPAVTPGGATTTPLAAAPHTASGAPVITPMIKVSTDVPNKVAPASAPSKITNNLESLPSTPFGSIPRSATGHRLSRRLQHLAPEVVNSVVKERRHSKRHSDEHLSTKSASHKDVSGLGLSFDDNAAVGGKSLARSGSECANSPPALSPVFSWNNAGQADAMAGAALQDTVREVEKAHGENGCVANLRTRHAGHPENKGQASASSTRSNGGKKNEKQTPIVPRLTRGLAASNKLAEKAVSILEQPVPDLIVPRHDLFILLDRCVVGTDGWSVTRLESIYSRLAARLLSFERVWDRTRLVAEYLEVLVDFAI